MDARITAYEDKEPAVAHSTHELEVVIGEADAHARDAGRPNIIFVETENGNSLSMVVGADETVLGFNYGHNDPPYYASRGIADSDEPIFTAFVAMIHHTEFSRRNVISSETGLAAVREFFESADLPTCIDWDTV
jgi:hypothetical protein